MSIDGKSILFIDNSTSDFSGHDLNTVKVRGTESTLILLAKSFEKRNYLSTHEFTILPSKAFNIYFLGRL